MVFSATWMDGQSSQMSLKGLCLRGAEPGDRLLHIEGMPYLLIVRELDEDKTVKIIGPVGAPSEWIEDRWRFTAEEKKRLWACDDNIQFEKFKFR